ASRSREEASRLRERLQQLLAEGGADTLEEFRELLGSGRERLKELDASQRALRERERHAATRARQAEGSQERYQELDQAYAVHRRLSEQAAGMEVRRARLERVKRMGELLSLRQICVRRVAEARAAQETHERARRHDEDVKRLREGAEARLAEARRRQSESQRLERQSLELESASEEVLQVQAAERDVQSAQAILDDLTAALEAGQRTARKLETALNLKEVRLAELTGSTGASEAADLRLRESLRAVQQARQAEELKVQLLRARRAAREDRGPGLEERVRNLREELARRNRSTLQWDAARLAQTLEKGEPCPVCGSKKHPDPAGTPGEAPDTERLSQLQAHLEQAERLLTQHQREQAEKQLIVERLQARLDQLLLEVGDYDLKELETRHASLEKEHSAHRDSRSEAQQLKDDLERLRGKGALLQARQQQVEGQRRQAEQRVLQARAVLEERLRRLEGKGTEAAELQQRWREAQERLQAMRADLDRAQADARQLGEQSAAARAAAEPAERALEAALQRQMEAQEDLRAGLQRAGLSRASELETPEQGEAWIAAETAAIRGFDDDLAAARHRLERARNEAAERELQDPTAFFAERDEVRTALEQQLAESARLSEKLAWMEKREGELADLSARTRA
ncbi:MAG: hypothetical protein AB1758_35230, partial [Candidatus Eremiobacterota bacterium]